MEVKDNIANGTHYKGYMIQQKDVGQPLDPAFICEHYSMSLMRETMLKKVLRCGDGDKSYTQDLLDIIGAAQRELELCEYRGK